MEGRRPKDVAALFERAGLAKTGSYREFANTRPMTRGSDTPSATMAPTEEISILIPAEVTPAPVHAEAVLSSASLTVPADAPGLDRVFAGNTARKANAASEQNCCSVGFFSLAGGVGKTTLAASVARILSGRGLRVVVANWGRGFAFQHLMGSRSQSVGSLTFIHAPNSFTTPPIILIECGEIAAAGDEEEALRLMEQASLRADVTLLDLPASLDRCTHSLLRRADHVVVPMLPDAQSAGSLDLLDEMLQAPGGPIPETHYILNRYQSSRSLHRETFDRLRGRLGYQLLPTYIREEPAIQDAMWSGVTVVDHAPNSAVVADLHSLAASIRQLSPRRSVRKGTTA